jgi:serine protease AprX
LREARAWRFWERDDGACPACVQESLLRTLLDNGHEALHRSAQAVWPLDAESAFGALPTPLRLHAHPRFRGRGVTIAIIDSGFASHADLVMPQNRVRAWVDASRDPVAFRLFAPDERPDWPGANASCTWMWHGTMTSVVAAGNGFLSNGLYRGLASEADVVLISAREPDGRISNTTIVRALEWLRIHGPALGVGVVNLSVSGDPVVFGEPDIVNEAVAALDALGMVIVAAAGNSGERRLVPPASAPRAITVGGIDDNNSFDHEAIRLWNSNYGTTQDGLPKPELVAPSMWVAAPVLPGSPVALRAAELFRVRREGQRAGDVEIDSLKLITEHYQHVEGTSFAAPVVASTVACMIEANPHLTPSIVRDILRRSATPVSGAPSERQGAGALEAGRAVAAAASESHRMLTPSPAHGPDGVSFHLHDHDASAVHVGGSWDDWESPGIPLSSCAPGWWRSAPVRLGKGRYAYKFRIDQSIWIDDPANTRKQPDGVGGFNAVFEI